VKQRILFAVVFSAGLALVPAAPAYAKGVVKTTLTGPGLARPLRLDGNGTAQLSQTAALYEAVFPQVPSPVVPGRPAGKLGPRYVATYGWIVAEGRTKPVRQVLYPFARGGALAYTPPGQQVFRNEKPFEGGWYRAGAPLTDLLVSLGVPARSVAQRA
jgi:hypothetical protein